MSHFYGDLQGNRGEATRCGTPKSGIQTHVRGWKSGVRVVGSVNDDGLDVFDIYATRGSDGSNFSRIIGHLHADPETGELVFTPGAIVMESM